MSDEIISVKNLTLRYSSLRAIDDVSFDVKRGDYVGVIGPNGSGKTTLIKTILGLIKPSSGRVTLFGQDISKFESWEKVGYLSQHISKTDAYFPATVHEILSLEKFRARNFSKDINQDVEQALESVGVLNLRHKLLRELSGGQRQRVMLAKALVCKPELLILDEPSSAMDYPTRKSFFEMLTKINREKRTTILLITHDMADIGRYSSKLLLLDRKLIFYGNMEEFCHSGEINERLGNYTQHTVCHRHDKADS
jgi:zinc transport system ATP-binding protein